MNKLRLPNENEHHILFHEKEYRNVILLDKYDHSSEFRVGEELREHPALRLPMDKEIHQDLQDYVEKVPALGAVALNYAYLEFQSFNLDEHTDPLDAIEVLQYSIGSVPEKLIKYEDIGVKELAIEALIMQVPYIEESLELREQILEDRRRNRNRRNSNSRRKMHLNGHYPSSGKRFAVAQGSYR